MALVLSAVEVALHGRLITRRKSMWYDALYGLDPQEPQITCLYLDSALVYQLPRPTDPFVLWPPGIQLSKDNRG
jgi:hypothetical protein